MAGFPASWLVHGLSSEPAVPGMVGQGVDVVDRKMDVVSRRVDVVGQPVDNYWKGRTWTLS